jgi:hypothetical protein
MKRLTVVLLATACLLSFVSVAAAKWVTIGRNKVGLWAVSDRVLAKQGGCVVTVAGVIFTKPRTTRWGEAVARKYKLRFCCSGWTYQMMAYQLVGKNKKIIYQGKGVGQAKKIPPGSILDKMIKVHCRAGAGGPGATAPPEKKTVK